MRLPSTDEFVQVRRLFPVVAAVLLVAALLLPMWHITVLAVQYPNEPLELSLYAYPHISGDYWEMAELNQYIGFYFPDPVYWQPNYEVKEAAIDVPEWSFGPFVFLLVAGLSIFVAVAPTAEKLKRGLTWQLVGAVSVFTVMLADIQYRLYQAGHSLDPDAPMVGVEGFTPPIWGKYEVANITSYSRLGMGAYVVMLGIALLVVAYYYRDTTVTVSELPGRAREDLGRLRDRIGGSGDDSGSGSPAGDGDGSPSVPTPGQR